MVLLTLLDAGPEIGVASLSRWRLLCRGGRLTRPLRYILIRSRVERELETRIEQHHKEMSEAIAAGRTVVEHEQGASQSTAFWQQGNLALQETDVLGKRLLLRSAPRILERLDRWWLTAVETERRRCAPSSNAPNGTIGQEAHARCLRPVYVALMDEYDPVDAESCIADDFLKDAGGQPRLSRELFCDAIFELCDVWTERVDEQEYDDFLAKLLEVISIEVPPDVASLAAAAAAAGRGNQEDDEEARLHPRIFRGDDQVQRIEEFHVGTKIAEVLEPTPRQRRGKRQKQRRVAASTIQAGARGNAGRKVVKKRKQAVQTIQAGARGRAGRKAATRKRSAVLTFQAHYRGMRIRLLVAMLKSASSLELGNSRSEPNIDQRPRYLDFMKKPKRKLPPCTKPGVRPGNRGIFIRSSSGFSTEAPLVTQRRLASRHWSDRALARPTTVHAASKPLARERTLLPEVILHGRHRQPPRGYGYDRPLAPVQLKPVQLRPFSLEEMPSHRASLGLSAVYSYF